MNKIIFDNKKIEKIIEYYKNNGLLILGFNDSQGVNTTNTFFKKGLLEYLAFALTCEEFSPKVINAFSLTMNKTEHIDYFLKNNLTVEEIKLSQIYSAVNALEKVMKDIKLPQFLGQIGNVYRLIYSPKKDDKNIKLSTSLKKAYEPIVVYSSGVNNLMREVGSNPFAIKGEYKARDKKPNYYYTLEKAKDPKTLNTVIDGIEKNYDNILNINPKADIYSLGAYIPKSLEIEGMNIFRELIVAYNEKLSELCKQYNITYINTENVGKTYNSSENNFHVSTSGHYALANYILEYIYKNKVNNNNVNNVNNVNKNIIELTNKGSEGIIDSVLDDYEKSYKKSQGLTGYAQSRELDIALEHINEAKVFRKVYQNKSN